MILDLEAHGPVADLLDRMKMLLPNRENTILIIDLQAKP